MTTADTAAPADGGPGPATTPGGCADPFAEGLDRDTTLRLLSGRFQREDLDAYYRTGWFRQLREKVIETYGSCCLCSCRFRLRLTAHHRHYRTLFREDVLTDVSCICASCHGKHHRARRGR